MKSVFIYNYTSSDGFSEFFQMLAKHSHPWTGEKVWETLESELRVGATCNALGHVRYEITLRDDKLSWSVRSSLLFDFGILSQHATEAEHFMMSAANG